MRGSKPFGIVGFLLPVLMISLLLTFWWYLQLAQWYVESIRPLMDWLLYRLSLGKWQVELVLLHLANWIPFVSLAAAQAIIEPRRLRVVVMTLLCLMLIIAGHFALSVCIAVLHVRLAESALFMYGMVVGFAVHDILPIFLWLRFTQPDWFMQWRSVRSTA